MKLVLYNSGHSVLDIRENLSEVQVSNDSVSWNDGELKGIKANFIIIPDEVEVDNTISEEIISHDIKNQFNKVDLFQENQELKKRLGDAEFAIITLMDRM